MPKNKKQYILHNNAQFSIVTILCMSKLDNMCWCLRKQAWCRQYRCHAKCSNVLFFLYDHYFGKFQKFIIVKLIKIIEHYFYKHLKLGPENKESEITRKKVLTTSGPFSQLRHPHITCLLHLFLKVLLCVLLTTTWYYLQKQSH